MSRKYNPYIFYSEYYFISGAYHVINVVNEILTYSASCSDNMKEYLRNQVVSKQVALNESIRNEQQHHHILTTVPNSILLSYFICIYIYFIQTQFQFIVYSYKKNI